MIPIGAPPPDDTALGLLLACHERMRQFTSLAVALGAPDELADDAVREVALSLQRYFTETLPLHARDEDESLLPRLKGRSPTLDSALERMRGDHEEHAEPLLRMVDLCARVQERPASLRELREEWLEAANALRETLLSHAAFEEQDVFPALESGLDADGRSEILKEMRARRL